MSCQTSQQGSKNEPVWEMYGPILTVLDDTDIHVIYQKHAGKTHFLNGTTASILKMLEVRGRTSLEVCCTLAAEPVERISSEDISMIDWHLRRLEALGLVCCHRPTP